MTDDTRQFAFQLADLQRAQAASDSAYHEFLRVPAMSAGLYVLPAGGTDPQQPHAEDEMYVVCQGSGKFICDGETVAVSAGTVLYVPAEADHRFFDIESDLHILVFFAPAESR